MYSLFHKPVRQLALGGLLAVLPVAAAWAQTPVWNVATVGNPTTGSTSQIQATAVNANGEVLVAGSFTGQLTLGSITLVSTGDQDLFVAKWLPASSTWAWAQRGGGTGADQALGLAVSGTSVYITGYLTNTAANTSTVTLGSTNVNGVSTTTGTTPTADLLLAKYVDAGSSASLRWTQVGGGNGADQGQAVAVAVVGGSLGSTTTVYVTGSITNDTNNTDQVVFGNAVAQYGATPTSSLDLVVAKYTDTGTSATLGWTQVGGGTLADAGQGIAANGTSVYVTGYLTNDKSDTETVQFGGTGTTVGTQRQVGTSTADVNDLILAKYSDSGTSATCAWTHVAGGSANDQGLAVAVSGTNIYVTGYLNNNSGNTKKVVFGGTGATAGTFTQLGAGGVSNDLVVAKYTDGSPTATFDWSQVGGGKGDDAGQAIAVNGTNIYVTGRLFNDNSNSNSVLFGGSGSTAGTMSQNGASSTASSDVVAAKYTDGGSSATVAWTQVGGGTGTDQGRGLALVGSDIYVVGDIVPAATFSSFTISSPAGSDVSFLGRLTPPAPLPVTLVSFTAGWAPGRTAVRLAWETATEARSSYFAVERSLDGVGYTSIGQLAAAGSAATTHTYRLLDAAPPTEAPTLYYRLRQVDQDGTTTYSPVCSVAGAEPGLALYPNPLVSSTVLTGAQPGATVRVLDALGQLVATATADGTGRVQLAQQVRLPRGLYLVRTGSQGARLTVE